MLSDQQTIGLLLSVLALGMACGVTGYALGRREAQRRYLPQIERLEDITEHCTLVTDPRTGLTAQVFRPSVIGPRDLRGFPRG